MICEAALDLWSLDEIGLEGGGGGPTDNWGLGLIVYGESLLRLYALRATLRLPECDFRRTSCPLKIEICWDSNSVSAGKS